MLFRSNDTATTEIYTGPYTLSLHDALPIFFCPPQDPEEDRADEFLRRRSLERSAPNRIPRSSSGSWGGQKIESDRNSTIPLVPPECSEKFSGCPRSKAGAKSEERSGERRSEIHRNYFGDRTGRGWQICRLSPSKPGANQSSCCPQSESFRA